MGLVKRAAFQHEEFVSTAGEWVSLQKNSLPQLPINNHVRTMLHVATHGLNHLLNKCVINNTFGKSYLPAAKTLGLGKNFFYKALIIKFRVQLTLHLLLT